MSKSKPELKLVEDTGSQLQDEDLIELPPQQSEMPFAVVEGEPMTQLPRDLYIPPDALQVFLTAFEGPLDLLLYLIRKQNLDILNIPIAEITRQYMQYIEVMADLQLELAGEYLLMAAMLAEIKSRMLLPRPPAVEGQEEEDPRAELVRRLQEYERFKKAAEDLDRLNRLERDNVVATAELEERKVVKLLPDVTLKEMLDAFRDVLARAEKFAHHHISRERLSQRERMSDILARLQTVAFFEFTELFKPEEGRMGVTVTFIAILELMKEGLIEIVQAEAYAPIHVRTAQRHLKVVQGGVTASETADAENEAALAQPELAGENDIPDEDETPPADNAAIAVQAAVADVAAASSIAVDSVESDHTLVDPGFVEAAVSEAIASTENAIETMAEVAASDAVAEEVAAGSPVVVDEVTLEDVPHDLSAAEQIVASDDPLETRAVAHDEAVAHTDAVEHSELVEHVADVVSEDAVAQSLLVTDESAAAVPESFEPSDEVASEVGVANVGAADAHVVEEHVIEEHEVEEHVVPEHVVEEHVVPAPTSVEENTSLAEGPELEVAETGGIEAPAAQVTAGADAETFAPAPEAATAEVIEEFVTSARADAGENIAEFVTTAEALTTEIADEGVASSDLTGPPVVDEHAQPAETTDVVADEQAASEAVDVDAEDVAAVETADIAEEAVVEPVEVAGHPTTEETNVVMHDAAGRETTNVVMDVAPAADAAEQDEATDEQIADLSEPELSKAGDSVTGASREADNSDAEKSR